MDRTARNCDVSKRKIRVQKEIKPIKDRREPLDLLQVSFRCMYISNMGPRDRSLTTEEGRLSTCIFRTREANDVTRLGLMLYTHIPII